MRAYALRSVLYCLSVLLIVFVPSGSPRAEEMHVVGDAAYRYLDGNWSQTIPERIQGNLRAIFALTENDIYIGSDDGLVYYYDGSTWDQIFEGPVPLNSVISSIWGTSNDNIYIIGSNGLFQHYDGSEWTEIMLPEPTTNYYHDIYGFSENDIYAVGRGSYNYIYHCDGSDPLSWDYVDISSLGVDIYCYAVWGTAGNDVYIAGSSGRIIHWDGIEWELLVTGTSYAFYDIWGTAGGDLFAVSSSRIYHFDGAEWSYAIPSYSSGSWFWVTGTSETNVLVGGSRDEVVHYDGIEWSELPGEEIGYSTDAIMLSSDFAIITDLNNKIFMYDGASIERFDLQFWMPALYDVSSTPGGTFYASGDAGYVYRFDGSSWIEIERLPETCNDIIAFADDDICVLAGGCVYHYNGGSWDMIGDLGAAGSVWGTSSDNLYVTGSYDEINHFDGTDWTVVHYVGCVYECPDPWCEELYCNYLNKIWGLSDYEIRAVGKRYDSYWHATLKLWCYVPFRASYDGTIWTTAGGSAYEPCTDSYYTCVSGSSSDDIWIGGDASSCKDLLHFNGVNWNGISQPFCGCSAIWSNSATDAYFLDGGDGDIYHYNGVDFIQTDLSDVLLRDLCGVTGVVATVLTDPVDPVFTIDGIEHDEPYSFNAEPGVSYEIGVESPQLIGDVEYWFVGWSDGGDTVHTFVMPDTSVTYIALFARPVDVTVATEPSGLDVIVSDNTYASPYILSMLSGDEIEIGTISPQRYKGADYYFVEWNDGGARTHTVTLPAEDVVYTAIFTDVLTGIEEPVPLVNALHQNHPNPFNPVTTVQFSLHERGYASLAIYDVAGRLVRVLADGVMEAGPHEVTWDGRDREGRTVASGVYFYRLEAGTYVETKKMVLLR